MVLRATTTRVAGLLAALLVVPLAVDRAAAVPIAPTALAASAIGEGALIQKAGAPCHPDCARAWPPRRYWQWGKRLPTDEEWYRYWSPYMNHLWGTPEPPYVPADIWAHKWRPPKPHLGWRHKRLGHHRHAESSSPAVDP